MATGEMLGYAVALLLAVYGCACLIRRVCLWFVRCPRCAVSCRLVLPHRDTAVEPLCRCLHSQAVWEPRDGCRHTLLLLTEETMAEWSETLSDRYPSVTPVTKEGLIEMLEELTEA